MTLWCKLPAEGKVIASDNIDVIPPNLALLAGIWYGTNVHVGVNGTLGW